MSQCELFLLAWCLGCYIDLAYFYFYFTVHASTTGMLIRACLISRLCSRRSTARGLGGGNGGEPIRFAFVSDMIRERERERERESP